MSTAERVVANRARSVALAAGQHKYLGSPCQKGHDGWRYTISSQCVQCTLESNNRGRIKAKTNGHRVQFIPHPQASVQRASAVAPQRRAFLICLCCPSGGPLRVTKDETSLVCACGTIWPRGILRQ